MTSDINSYKSMQEGLGRLVVAEQRVPVDAVQLARRGGRSTRTRARGRRLQAQQRVQPRLDGVAGAVTDRFFKFYL